MELNINGLLKGLSELSQQHVRLIDREIEVAEERLVMLNKLRGMCPQGKKYTSRPIGKMLEDMKTKRRKKPDAARPKKKPGEPLNLEGDLIPHDTRCKMIAGLIDAQGAMTTGVLAELMKCSVKTIYNDIYRHEEWFGRDSNGVTLTIQGRKDLLQ
ncbi:MAG: hypothetical protein JNJ77_19930 [Planctomycetia bacterium]|nr:hypothetical protein [Planctomycetia bacterium]